MTEVGGYPTLDETLEALSAIEKIEVDTRALDPREERFAVTLTFIRADCPGDWANGQPKPTWLIDKVIQELHAWRRQHAKEEMWVSKDEQLSASIEGLMGHYTARLKTQADVRPETMHSRMRKRTLSDTILRLKELMERREAGGVYSQTQSRREKARRAWEEDEYAAPKREEEQTKQRYTYETYEAWDRAYKSGYASSRDSNSQAFREQYNKLFEDMFERANAFRQPPPKPSSGNKQPWHTVLGVSVNASKDDIKKAHRKLVKQYQPRTSADAEDRTRAEKMMEINTARDEGLGGL